AAETVAGDLARIPGVGDWTAQYVAMRALGEPDAFPAGDLVLRRVAGGGKPLTGEAMRLKAEQWRPGRGYAAGTPWRAASDEAWAESRDTAQDDPETGRPGLRRA